MSRPKLIGSWLVVVAILCAAAGAGDQQRDEGQVGGAKTAKKTGDWPMLGGSPDRNTVSGHTGIPDTWNLRKKQNVKWMTKLGTTTYGVPVVADGRVYVGTNNAGMLRPEVKGDKGVLVCLEEKTGKLLWQATHDKMPSGQINDWPEQGIASAPWVEGNRLYYVSNECQLVCADVEGFIDGENDGPYSSEKLTTKQDADLVWVLDMYKQLKVHPHNLAVCSPVGLGDLVFVATGKGVDESHVNVPNPDAPDVIAVNKKTGNVVWQWTNPSQIVFQGQWSSLALGTVAGKPQLVFGAGDGWCYSFEPATGKLLWKFNLNNKSDEWKPHGRGTANSIVATPVIFDDKVFLGAGQDPDHGPGPGNLCCINATMRGDITEKGCVWRVGGEDFGRTISSVTIADGLLYAAELAGYLYCLDVKTGKQHWKHDTFAGVWGAPLVVDGKVMLGTTDGEVIVLKHGRTLEEIAGNDVGATMYSTPIVANGVLYVTSRRAVIAIASGVGQAKE